MRLPRKPPLAPKHREERLKLAASGLQALALALFGAVLIAPAFNAQLAAPVWVKLALSAIASVAEGLAFFVLRYIPAKSDPQEGAHG